MIYIWDNPLIIGKLLTLVKEAKDIKDTPIDKLREFMLKSLSNPNARTYVESIDGVIKGFVLCSIEEWQCEDALFIHMCVIKPEAKYTGFELMTKVKLFSKEKNIKVILMATTRNPKSWERKYGFEFEASLLKIDLEKETKNEH